MLSLTKEKFFNFAALGKQESSSEYYPAGSFGSLTISSGAETSSRKSVNPQSGSDCKSLNNSIDLISYESVTFNSQFSHKELQTSFEFFSEKPSSDDQEVLNLKEKVKDLSQKCKVYEKQNEELRKEISQANSDLVKYNISSLLTEMQCLRSKLNLHETMLVKILNFKENSRQSTPEIFKQLCGEINSYSNENTPDCIGFSRKNSMFMESTNKHSRKYLDDKNDCKRPSSSVSEANENSEYYAKGGMNVLKSAKKNTKNASVKPSHKTVSSLSVSPLGPAPAKQSVKMCDKENYKASTLKVAKNPSTDTRKRKISRQFY